MLLQIQSKERREQGISTPHKLLSNFRLHRFKHASADDPVLSHLRSTIQQEWPTCKSDVAHALHSYYDFRDELTTQEDLVFKGSLVISIHTEGDDGTMPRDPHWMCLKGQRSYVLASDGNGTQGVCLQV